MAESDEFDSLPSVTGAREAVLTRPDFEMMLVLRAGKITERAGQLFIDGYSLSPLATETLTIRSLLRKGVARVEEDGRVMLTPDAEELIVHEAPKYGIDARGLNEKVRAVTPIDAIRQLNCRQRRERRRG